jgi:ABC-type uncharacterized transport system involved in gliding motility auxiliary subunit
MAHRFRSGLILLAGVALLAAALALQAVLLETLIWTRVLAGAGAVLSAWGVFALRGEIAGLVRRRRGEVALFTIGVVGVLVMTAYLSTRFSWRFDLTEAGLHSLSAQTSTMLRRLDRPVRVVFFHDPLMRETVELYELMAEQSDQLTVEFHDPTLNPARARMMGVQFAGTAVMESGERRLLVHGATETDIANGILRVSLGGKQRVCFVDGHGEADPFSRQSHDHMETAAGADHSHGLGAQYVLNERHGLAKAREGLETLGYEVRALSLTQGDGSAAGCAVLVFAGPKVALLDSEIAAVRAYLAAGGNAFFMLDPFVPTGLEPVLAEYGVVADEAIVIDDARHYWTDVTAPAVTSYNNHPVTRELPLTFYPGARSFSPTAERVPGTNVMPVVNSSKSSFGETDAERAEFDEGRDLPGPRTLMVVARRRPLPADDVVATRLGPEGENVPAARASPPSDVTGDSRIAVVGDSDFATNSFFHFLGNGNLFLNTVNYLAAQENLIGIEPRTHDLPKLSVTNRQMKGTFVLSMVLVPAVLAIIGTAVWWRQR